MRFFITTLMLAATMCGFLSDAFAADAPSAKLAMSFKPVHGDADIEVPTDQELAQCQVKQERLGKGSGWIVLGPAGQVLRRFVDTNGDNVVDQWRYYKHGVEVYRDVDANYNNKVDESRWLNHGGTRWGIDKDENGRVDAWKRISAEETSQVAIRALVTRDPVLLQTVLVTPADLQAVRLEPVTAKKILEQVARPAEQLQQVLSQSKLIGPGTEWMRFDAMLPSVIPQDAGQAAADLIVYENAMAIVDNGGASGLVQMGEMLQVGDTWKLTQVPRPIEGNTVQVAVGGVLMQPELSQLGAAGGLGDVSPEMQKLLDQLQQLDANSPAPSATQAALVDYNARRAEILARLVNMASSAEERDQWLRQMIDGIAAAVQTGNYPDGLKRLESLSQQLQKNDPDSDVLPYLGYRKLLAEYSARLQDGTSDERVETQEWWITSLNEFLTRHPRAEDAPEAMLQLAVTLEFSGRIEDAVTWYEKLAKSVPDSLAGRRAAGAMARLNIKGKPLSLAGSLLQGGKVDVRQLRGRVVMVFYWATWCQPCTEDLPQLRALYEQYHDRGFEILGVNLDTSAESVRPFLQQHRVAWPQIHEPGGLESGPAVQLGVISLPTMILLDKQGEVVSRNIAVDDLKAALPELLGIK